jgi:hypothetical protein
MKKTILFLSLVIAALTGYAQKPATGKSTEKPVSAPTLSKTDLQKIGLIEDTLQRLSMLFTADTVLEVRKKACYQFIPRLVSALKYNYSFYYPFDSLQAISQVYPPDSSFRILTWQLFFTVPVKVPAAKSKTGRDTIYNMPEIRYYGVIQMRSKTMKIYPLYDAGDTLSHGTQQILSHNNWWGQLYYKIIQNTAGNKTYYTTFGYEAADRITRRKIIDVLTFDKNGLPHFGAPVFHFKYDDSLAVKKLDTLTRFFIEYKWNAPTVLNYDKKMQMIVFDHVAPMNPKARGATFTYVPDGTYEGFEWQKDHWQWKEKVFNFAINENDNPPVPVPLFGQPARQPELPK